MSDSNSATGGGSSAEEPPPTPFFREDPFAQPPPYQAPSYPPPLPPYGGGPPPGWQARYPAPTDTNGFAIASLVFSLLWLLGVGSLLGMICGFVALRQLGQRPARGRALAVIGIVAGAIGIVLTLVYLAANVLVPTSTTPTV